MSTSRKRSDGGLDEAADHYRLRHGLYARLLSRGSAELGGPAEKHARGVLRRRGPAHVPRHREKGARRGAGQPAGHLGKPEDEQSRRDHGAEEFRGEGTRVQGSARAKRGPGPQVRQSPDAVQSRRSLAARQLLATERQVTAMMTHDNQNPRP